MECDRNPSPPPEVLQNYDDLLPDRVGDTMFSKRWLIQILMNIIEAVNKELVDNPQPDDAEAAKANNSEVLELDPKLEDDACSLWDMSANKDVAYFLHEFKVEDIFLEVIDKTKSPRLLEIVIGILGNMASFSDICESLSDNETLLKSVISLTGTSDAPTIVQVLRLMHSGVVNEEVGDIWLDAMCEDETFMQNVRFILENSLNGEVLKNALQLLYYLLDKQDDICIKWAESAYVSALVASGKQLSALEEFESIDEFWLLLNLMFQHEENIAAFSNSFDELQPIYVSYLMKFGDGDYCCMPPVHRVAALAASFTTLATFLKGREIKSDMFVQDEKFKKYIKNMMNSVTEVLEKGIILEKQTEVGEEERSVEKMAVNDESDIPEPSESKCDSSASCRPFNGESDSTSHGKLSRSISVHEDDYNNIFILKETMVELCAIIMPSIIPEKEEDG